MTSYDWRPVGEIDPRELGKARHLAHNGAQWLARIAHSYIDPADDGAHTNLGWDTDGDALVTQEIAPGLVLELRLPELILQFKEEGKRVTHQLVMDDRSPAEVEAWLLVELLHRDVDRDRLSKDLPYKIPGLMTGDANNYSAEPFANELKEFSRWYANAASVLGQLHEKHGSAPILCSPQHIVMETSFPLDKGNGARSAKVGLAPGDGYYGEPYFHVTPSPAPDAGDLPAIPEIGQWHTKDFIAAVLPASRVVEDKLSGDDVVAFLDAVLSAERGRA